MTLKNFNGFQFVTRHLYSGRQAGLWFLNKLISIEMNFIYYDINLCNLLDVY